MTMGSLFLLSLMSTTANGSYVDKVDVAGATLHVEIRQPVQEKKAREIVDWVRATANTVNLTYGRFPNPSPKVVVIPSIGGRWGGDSAVTFGRVTRWDGETIELFVNPDRPIEEFYEDWTATHEFSHLMLPLLSREYRWISEGFATYYQNVLMARAGRYTPEFAWQKLVAGFERGQDSRPDLSPNEAAREGIAGARMKIYWSGAALALLADIELRERSNGAESLDSVLDEFQACCLPSRRTWSGQRLLSQLDTFVDEPVFMPLYRQYANRQGFPEFDKALSDLGVAGHYGEIRLRDDARLAHIRQAISGSR